MDIIKYNIYNSPNIGIYAKTNNEFSFIPNGLAKSKAEKLSGYLHTKYIFTSIANTRLLGILMVVNDHGILLPKTCLHNEIDNLKKTTDLNINVVDTKYTALGNIICANNNGGIISPLIPKTEQKKIEDTLDIELIQKQIAGYNQVGIMIIANSYGGIAHPKVNNDEIKEAMNILKINIEKSTINGGIQFISSGIIINDKSAIVGTLTNGSEMIMLTKAFMN